TGRPGDPGDPLSGSRDPAGRDDTVHLAEAGQPEGGPVLLRRVPVPRAVHLDRLREAALAGHRGVVSGPGPPGGRGVRRGLPPDRGAVHSPREAGRRQGRQAGAADQWRSRSSGTQPAERGLTETNSEPSHSWLGLSPWTVRAPPPGPWPDSDAWRTR